MTTEPTNEAATDERGSRAAGVMREGATEHRLKTWPSFWRAVADGSKPFEVRACKDRDFQKGDTLVLEEWDPATAQYTGRVIRKRVSCILMGSEWGIQDGYVVMGLAESA